MHIEFSGSYSNSITEELLYLNTITVRRNDGQKVVLDREETDYGLNYGIADIIFCKAYVWDGEKEQYLENSDLALYDGAELIDYEIEDDAPEGYDLTLCKGQRISAW